MIIIITGASHTGKTILAQKMMEKYKYPYLSIDLLKMGLIRSQNTSLTPEDDKVLTDYLWPIVREIIKTAIENKQNLIVEGCYIPFDWRKDFDNTYITYISFICIAFTENYVNKYFHDIITHRSDIESRIDNFCDKEAIISDNNYYSDGFKQYGEKILIVDDNYDKTIQEYINKDILLA